MPSMGKPEAAVRIQAAARGHLARNKRADLAVDRSRRSRGPAAATSRRSSRAGAARAAAGHGEWPSAFRADSAWGQLPHSDEAIRKALRATRELRVFATTWNMGGKAPDRLNRAEPGMGAAGGAHHVAASSGASVLLAPQGRYHLLVYCAQECERSIAASAMNPSKARWEAALEDLIAMQPAVISPGGAAAAGADGPDPEAMALAASRAGLYKLVASQTLQATHVAVFAHRAIVPLVSDVTTEAVPCGAAGRRLGNKGGVCVGVCVGNTSLLVVGCHLAAGEGPKAALARVSDVTHIESACTLAPADWRGPVGTRATDRFDRTIWLGDLNFRCDTTRTFADACLREGRHSELLERDELRAAMRAGSVFRGFGEGPLRFRPTYKLSRATLREAVEGRMSLASQVSPEEAAAAAALAGDSVSPLAAAALSDTRVDVYDPSAKRRVPSWTDRVLVRPATGHSRVVSYAAATRERLSDHRPVVAAVALRLRRHATIRQDEEEGGAPWGLAPSAAAAASAAPAAAAAAADAAMATTAAAAAASSDAGAASEGDAGDSVVSQCGDGWVAVSAASGSLAVGKVPRPRRTAGGPRGGGVGGSGTGSHSEDEAGDHDGDGDEDAGGGWAAVQAVEGGWAARSPSRPLGAKSSQSCAVS